MSFTYPSRVRCVCVCRCAYMFIEMERKKLLLRSILPLLLLPCCCTQPLLLLPFFVIHTLVVCVCVCENLKWHFSFRSLSIISSRLYFVCVWSYFVAHWRARTTHRSNTMDEEWKRIYLHISAPHHPCLSGCFLKLWNHWCVLIGVFSLVCSR